MNRMKKIMLIVLPLFAAVQSSLAQYGQHLLDVDSFYNWGWAIANKPDNTLMIIGWSENKIPGYSMFNMNVSSDGSTILKNNELRTDGMTIGPGDPGQISATDDGGHILPFLKQWPNPTTGYLYSASGIMKYNSAGDTVFTRIYTDTSVNFDGFHACTVMNNGDYVIGGGHGLNTASHFPGYIIRTNSIGDTIWTHTYQKQSDQTVDINAVSCLPNGHILVGALTRRQENPDYVYNCDAPWFMELDEKGDIVKDTVYSQGYRLGGNIYPDRLGGYYHYGAFDSLKTKFPDEAINFPQYLAHMDTNFRIDWMTEFLITDHYRHRYPEKVRQLRDGNFLVLGEVDAPYILYGWASKVDRTGKILWNHYYVSDSTLPTEQVAYLRDAAEQPNGDLVFVGATYNDTMPTWHNDQDVWIIRTDSNGCIQSGGCDPDVPWQEVVPVVAQTAREFRTYPNPTNGSFVAEAPGGGLFVVYNMLGQELTRYTITVGKTELQLPAGIATGIYMGVYKPDDGGRSTVTRIVKE